LTYGTFSCEIELDDGVNPLSNASREVINDMAGVTLGLGLGNYVGADVASTASD
jgi:hypothetical protein